MTERKFDTIGESYWERFVEPNRAFYDEVQKTLKTHFSSNKSLLGTVLDIGAGPGAVARLLDEAGLNVYVVGWEPSELHEQGSFLAQRLSSRPGLSYLPKKGDLKEALVYSIDKGYDYGAITFVRSAHEIAESSSRDVFAKHFTSASRFVSPGGMLLVADPMYTKEAASKPDVIRDVQAIQQRTIGHTHVPEDYISPDELSELVDPRVLKLNSTKEIAHPSLQEVAAKHGLKQTPIVFYIASFVRGMR